MIALAAVVLVLCVTFLTAWRWFLAERRWVVSQRAQQRDEALALFEPRIKALEESLRSAQWAQSVKR